MLKDAKHVKACKRMQRGLSRFCIRMAKRVNNVNDCFHLHHYTNFFFDMIIHHMQKISVNARGQILSGLMLLSSVAVAVLTFTTNCHQIEDLQGLLSPNGTFTHERVEEASRGVGLGLVGLSLVSVFFERHLQGKLKKALTENDELKSQRGSNEPTTADEPLEAADAEPAGPPTPTVTEYPKAVKFFSNS